MQPAYDLDKVRFATDARAFERADLDMIELFDPDVDALAYIVTKTMGERVQNNI